MQRKKVLDEHDIQDILQICKMGIWRIEFSETEAPRFYADAVMNQLIGTPEDMNPEERFVFHRAHIHPEDIELFLKYADKLEEEQTEIVYRYIHPEKGEMYVRCSGKKDDSVKEYGCVKGFHQDISDTMRMEKDNLAEQHLAEINCTLRKEHMLQQNYYKELLDVQSCGLMAYTLPGYRIIHMNAEALRMYGYEDIQSVQDNMHNVIRGFYFPNSETVEKLKALRNKEGSEDYEFIINKGTDKECHALAKTEKLVSPEGEDMVVTTFLDVSDMVTLQKALKRAEEGSRAKTAFLFNMSHDLRTPMNAIIGYSELMEKHWGEKEITTEYLHKLQEASGLLLELINNVLEMARIESGKEVLHEVPCNIVDLCSTLSSILDGSVREKNLKITHNVNVKHNYIVCDPLKMNEILMNIFSNAIKYTPEGGSITAGVEELPSAKSGYADYKVTVSDTGIGIGREYIPYLFQPFSREQTSSESGISGTGLGLAIVKSLVDLMGGTISVESELEKGTTFCLRFSHRLMDTTSEQVKQTTLEIDMNALKGKKILLAEDNELNAEISMTILADAGLQVELAEDGQKVIEMLEASPADDYDLILMDIQMPHMNGYEATKKIRAMKNARASIPIVAMTANAFEEDRKAAFAAGMNEHIAKPIQIAKLMDVIGKMVLA